MAADTDTHTDTDAVRVLYFDGEGGRRTRFETRFEREAPEHSLRTADSLDSALAAIDSSATPHCVVAAATATDRDGLDLLAEVRTRWHGLPFVLAVEDGTDELAAAAVEAGTTAYVPLSDGGAAVVSRAVELGREAATAPYENIGEFLQDAIDALDDVFYVFDADAGLVRWNDRLAELFGLTGEELSGMAPPEFFVEADRPAVERAAHRAVTEGQSIVEARAETVEGLVHFQLTGRRLTDPNGRVVGLCGVGRDVTSQRRSERRLRQQNERLEQFANVVSHDLRNPLAISTGYLDLERETNDSQNLGRVADALRRMSVIVENVLTAARDGLAVEDPRPTDVGDVAREAWTTVETGSAVLRVESNHVVSADSEYLRRVFENLFRNAVEHGSASGPTESDDSAEHGSRRRRDGVTVTVGDLPDGFYVADDGPGIDVGVRETAFDVGVSTNADGTGFGLSIVRSLATAHEWDVTLADADRGARFEFRNVSILPR